MKKMNFKKQILNILTESFTNSKTDKMKSLVKLLKENKDLRDLYLFYGEIEKKQFDNKQFATSFVDLLSEHLKGKCEILKDKTIQSVLNEDVTDNDVENAELYEHLDALLENDSLKNIDAKLIAKQYIVNYLISERKTTEDEIETTINENLLNTVLTTNFNTHYNTTLSEEEKRELKSIVVIKKEDFNETFNTLKESLKTKVNELMNESDEDIKETLKMTHKEIELMESSRYNYYKLNELKKDLITD